MIRNALKARIQQRSGWIPADAHKSHNIISKNQIRQKAEIPGASQVRYYNKRLWVQLDGTASSVNKQYAKKFR